MTLAALDSDVQTIWWITLGIGLVVAVVVVVLLQILVRSIAKIDEKVEKLWLTATTLARNTATTWMLDETGSALEKIKAEALRHDELLSRGNGR